MQSETLTRRRSPRLAYTTRVQLEAGELSIRAFSANLSLHGLFVESRVEVPEGSSVRVTFSVGEGPERAEVIAVGSVRRIVRRSAANCGMLTGFGIEFDEFVKGQRAVLGFLRFRLGASWYCDAPMRRQRPRTTTSVPVFWGERPDDLEREGTITNVSETGAFIETGTPAAIGAHLYIWFDLPIDAETQIVRATASVVRVAEESVHSAKGMGVAFEASTLDIDILQKFVESRLRPFIPDPAEEPEVVEGPDVADGPEVEVTHFTADEPTKTVPVPVARAPLGRGWGWGRVSALVCAGLVAGVVLSIAAAVAGYVG